MSERVFIACELIAVQLKVLEGSGLCFMEESLKSIVLSMLVKLRGLISDTKLGSESICLFFFYKNAISRYLIYAIVI